MMILALLLPALVAGFPGGDHHGDGHEDGCVDISRYSEILYNVTEASVCSFKTTRTCVKHKKSACVPVPVKSCRAVPYPDCSNEAFTVRMHDDKVVGKTFVGKQCKEQGFHTLTEIRKEAVCEQVTKEQCDSKWVINDAGEKVWAGNENCRDVTFEDCRLKDVPKQIQVPKYVCTDLPVATYAVPVFAEVDVTGYRAKCEARAYAECSETMETVCADLEFEEYTDTVVPNCFPGCAADGTCGTMKFRIPYQTYDHRLKCLF